MSSYIPQSTENRDKYWIPIFLAAVFIIAKRKRTQMPINRWMDKQDVYPYNEILFYLVKEWYSDKCCNIYETWKHYARWNYPETNKIVYDILRIGKNHRDKKWNRHYEWFWEIICYCLMDTGFLFGMMEKFWKWVIVMVLQYWKYTNATELST